MKRFFLLVAVLFIFPMVQAQTYGIKGGLNFASLSGNDGENFDSLTSFHIGGFMAIRLFDNLAIQPELLYSVQGAEIDGEKYKLNYFILPVMVKFNLTRDFSLHAGPQFGLLAGETADVAPTEGKTSDFAVAGGVGLALSKSIFLQARYVSGQTQVFEDADVKNSVIQISINFLF